MMPRPLIIVGAGGFARETIDIVRAINEDQAETWELRGVVDDAPSEVNLGRLAHLNVPFLGAVDTLATTSRDISIAIGVGSPTARKRVCTRLDGWGFDSPDLCHPTAILGSSLKTNGGLVACAHASVGTNVALGRHIHLNPHAVIGHDTVLQDFVSINPAAAISGECVIGERTLVGASAVILQGLSVAPGTTIGAAACVVQDVDEGRVLKGIPAR